MGTHRLSWNVSALQKFSNLQQLRMINGSISGTLVGINNLNRLTSLKLSGNRLQGNLTGSVDALARLQVLDLSYNQLTSGIFTLVTKCTNLTSLNLASNFLTGPIPEEITALSQLNYLNLAHNNFIGEVSAHSEADRIPSGSLTYGLSTLSLLTILNVEDNDLSNTIPSDLGNNPALTTLDASNNAFSGSILNAALKGTNLISVDLSNNQLSGSLPIGVIGVTNLYYLDLRNNLFTSFIPINYKLLSKLQVLHLEGNKLMGNLTSLPVSLVDCVISPQNTAAIGFDCQGTLPVACQSPSPCYNAYYEPTSSSTFVPATTQDASVQDHPFSVQLPLLGACSVGCLSGIIVGIVFVIMVVALIIFIIIRASRNRGTQIRSFGTAQSDHFRLGWTKFGNLLGVDVRSKFKKKGFKYEAKEQTEDQTDFHFKEKEEEKTEFSFAKQQTEPKKGQGKGKTKAFVPLPSVKRIELKKNKKEVDIPLQIIKAAPPTQVEEGIRVNPMVYSDADRPQHSILDVVTSEPEAFRPSTAAKSSKAFAEVMAVSSFEHQERSEFGLPHEVRSPEELVSESVEAFDEDDIDAHIAKAAAESKTSHLRPFTATRRTPNY
ncbi:Receptor protein kinase-like protein [Planoprotostelium fungivorum]|uniref:Receptor protein kinase-like protein n=1 Tax=Planoprotostelium fungivorum TaxID=1890364 RepID=A0A2P6NG43_9EUKA|nr:Receptor protein kinase-like protein [Planoprotostelium fungivorum]